MAPEPATERFALRRHRVVSAGAGTGKTHALLTQYLHLLAGFTALGKPLEPRAIAALTFTEKAAAEMRDRLGRRLLRLLHSADDLARNRVASEPDLCRSAATLGLPWPAAAHFEAARAQLASAPIGTFHSFAAALLRRNALVAGVEPDFELLDEQTARDLLGEACERAVLAALDDAADETLAQNTAELVTEFGFAGDLGLVAALCRLLAQRGEEGSRAAGLSDPYAEPVLRAEAEALKNRVAEAFATLTGLAPQLGGKSAERMAIAAAQGPALLAALSSLASLDQAPDLFERLRAELRYIRAGAEDLRELLSSARDSLRGAAEDAEALAMSVRAAPWADTLTALLDRAQALYVEAKQGSAALDFSDLLRKSRDLLRDDPLVRRREASRYAVLLVDEFQDTSPLQAEILSLLIEPGETTQETPPRPLYIVGDRKQSIYGFRGADVAAYEQVCQQLVAAGADEETLSRSHRSRPGLIATTNTLFARVFAAPPPSGDAAAAALSAVVGPVRWDAARDELQSTRPDSPEAAPLVEVLSPKAAADDAADAAATAAPESLWPADAMGREAALLTARLRQLLDGGTRPRQVVILLRRFTHLLRYTGALTQAGVPYYVVRGRGFFAAQEVLDLAAFVSLIDDPHDRLALIAVLRSPLCGLSDDALGRLHLAGLLSLPALLRTPPGDPLGLPADEAGRLADLVQLARDLLRGAARMGPLASLQTLLDATDYLALLGAEDGRLGASLAAQRTANVERLLERAAAHEARGGSFASFARALRRDSDPRVSGGYGDGDDPLAATAGEADDVVRIMTIHQSKGLEFPVVFVAGCASPERSESPAIAYDRAVGLGLRVFQARPNTSGALEARRVPTLAARRVHSVMRLRSLAESARLFYVAATRASERLILLGESARGPAPGGTWKAQIESLRAERPDLIALSALAPGSALAAPAGPIELSPDSPILQREAEQLSQRAYAPPRIAPPASGLPLSLAAATDLAVCPRRYHLRHRFALRETDPALPATHADHAAGAVPLSQLATDLLCASDPRRGDDDVLGRLALTGYSLRDPAVGELLTRLRRFLDSEIVRRLSQPSAPPLTQAVPFDVPVGALRLRDRFDWVIGDPAGPGDLHLIVFRYGYSPDPESLLSVAASQMLALAARLHFGAQRGLHVAFCDLREAAPRVRFRPVDDLLPAAAPSAALGDSAAALLSEREALSLPRLARGTCESIRCGYRYLCFPSPRSQPC